MRLPTRVVGVEAARARFGDRVDRVASWLAEADPLADAAVAALAELPPWVAEAQVDSALAGGDAAEPVAALVAAASAVPAWVDFDRADAGGAFFLRAGLSGGLVLGARSLVLGYASPAGNKPLALSGRLRALAPRRLAETSRFVQAVSLPGGMRPGAEGWRITLRVRLMHARVRRLCLASGRWDSAAWGAPLNQHDLAATTLLFSTVLHEGLAALGLRPTAAEREAHLHLWRWVARVLGVAPELLPGNVAEADALGAVIGALQAPPDADSRALVDALIEAGNVGLPAGDPRRRVNRAVGHTLVRALVGEPLADALGVRKTGLVPLVSAVSAAVAPCDRLQRATGVGSERLRGWGERYWADAVRRGLGGEPASYPLPEALPHAG